MESNSADTESLRHRYVLGQRVDGTSYEDTTARVLDWALRGESRYVCVANVHVVMEGHDDANYRKIINDSDLVTPDGVPLVWSLRAFGVRNATRVYGPDLTLCICEAAARKGIKVGLYGGTDESLCDFVNILKWRFPNIEISCAISPPFRPITDEEDAAYTRQIRESGTQVLFVGIGCPKQERWMSAHQGKLLMPMLGVGAAFDFHSGRVRQAPTVMQKLGLEWLFRLGMEPGRLWRRYAWHNPRFMLLISLQIIRDKFRY